MNFSGHSVYRKPIPAIGIAICVGVAAGKANANAARAIGIPVLAFSGLLTLLLMFIGFSA